MKRLVAAALCTTLVLTGVVAGCAGRFGRHVGLSELDGATYVALGSSMAAGPGLGTPKAGTPERCTRSFINYPTLLAEMLRMTLYDVTCSGATTDHVLAAWDELPAQIDAVTPQTRLVTITIGGNDLNYVGNLLASSCGPGGTLSIGGNSFECPPRRAADDAAFARLETNLRDIASQVKQRAPRARVLFVEYLRLVPETLCAATPISESDAAEARIVAGRLSELTAKVARSTNAEVVRVHEASRDHTPCDMLPWVVGNAAGYDGLQGAPWHPNAAGMRAVAQLVRQRLIE